MGVYITTKNWTPGEATEQLRGKGGRRGQRYGQETHDSPRGEKRRKKTHPKRPRKKDSARWHHFSLIRQRHGGGVRSESRDTWGAREMRVGGKGWAKQAAWDPDWNTPARTRCKEAGREGWREAERRNGRSGGAGTAHQTPAVTQKNWENDRDVTECPQLGITGEKGSIRREGRK